MIFHDLIIGKMFGSLQIMKNNDQITIFHDPTAKIMKNNDRIIIFHDPIVKNHEK